MEARILRIGGRLQRSSESYDVKHLIILPRSSHLTILIVDDMHRKSGHNAAAYVINEPRRRFYIVSQERTVKHLIMTHCMSCRNRRAAPFSQIMSPLPPARTEGGQCLFTVVGANFMDPILTKC